MKSFNISASGLKNIVINKFTDDNDFLMVFGTHEVRMNSIYAEFICPHVSHLHQSDPTIDTIKFDELFENSSSDFSFFTNDIFTEDIIFLFKQISSGNSINISSEQGFKLRLLSIIIGNEELFSQINQNFPPDFIDTNFELYLKYIECCYHFSQFSQNFDFSELIGFISSNFYTINYDLFMKLPRSVQYSIISNQHLVINSEDQLLDVVNYIFERNNGKGIQKEDEEFNYITFSV